MVPTCHVYKRTFLRYCGAMFDRSEQKPKLQCTAKIKAALLLLLDLEEKHGELGKKSELPVSISYRSALEGLSQETGWESKGLFNFSTF